MINALSIENFKCFDQLRLQLAPLTLLTGFNAAGKSSAIQPLLLLAQGARWSPDRAHSLNGPLVRLGAVGDILPNGSSVSQFRCGLETEVGTARWTFNCRAGERQVESVDIAFEPNEPNEVDEDQPGFNFVFHELLRDLTYIGAVRDGLTDAYPLPDLDSRGVADVGVDGRFAAYWYDRFVDDELAAARRHPAESATSWRKQADAWFSTLFPGAQVNVQYAALFAAESLQFRLSEIGEWRRPANVGYGLSYAFPILVALLAAKEEKQVVVIDSPEAHLHPRAQSQMGRILAKFAAAGVQIIVETHSDHLLNGVRLAVKEGLLDSRSLAIHFFTGVSKDGHGVVSPVIDREGQLSDWPRGFFDQSERDLAALSGWE